MSAHQRTTPHPHETSVVETIQSLIVAFVLAMTFRGFVTEGFVIPTGSMAPTLLGQHLLLHSEETGAVWPAGPDLQGRFVAQRSVRDPMLGWGHSIGQVGKHRRPRMGDRVLVVKSLYPFSEPDRFDVVVFKNPTDPNGGAANYIKRLIGLPNEKIWLTDGDVFAGDVNTAGMEGYRVCRKPEYIQRAVWQPVYHSDYFPVDPGSLNRAYRGPYWSGDQWQTRGTGSYVCETASETTLQWNDDAREITDWNYYNMLWGVKSDEDVSDLRVSAGVVADDPAALEMTFEIQARCHLFQFQIENGRAQVRMKPDYDIDTEWSGSEWADIALPAAGGVFNVEFWHVDQAMWLFINDERVAYFEYDWTPARRLMFATDNRDVDETSIDLIDQLVDKTQTPPMVRWTFAGSPTTLHRVQLDRDLHYKTPALTRAATANPTSDPSLQDLLDPGDYGYGTHPSRPAEMNGNQFYMLGDNSAGSLDSRLWGNPHTIVADQIDPAPFLVNRKLLLGKAWVVYFPAPYATSEGKRGMIPDFGRMRFIR